MSLSCLTITVVLAAYSRLVVYLVLCFLELDWRKKKGRDAMVLVFDEK